MSPDDRETLRAGLVRSLLHAAPEGRAQTLAERVLESIPEASSLEASVRLSEGRIRGGRMMVERATAGCAAAIAEALALPWERPAHDLLAAVDVHGLTLITGWDVGGEAPLYKLYANASDASPSVREAVARALGVEGTPHVIGVNVRAARVEWKAYTQHDSVDPLPVPPPEALRDVDAAAWVASYDQHPSRLRALFVAPRDPERNGAAFERLLGRSWSAIAAAMPFPVGALRQLGWSPEGVFTAYAKPRIAARRVHRLSPNAVFTACFSGACVEVGLFVVPNEDAARAYTRTARHALSFRNREGSPPRGALEPLARWAAARVQADDEGTGWRFDDPPPPWCRKPGDEPDGDPDDRTDENSTGDDGDP